MGSDVESAVVPGDDLSHDTDLDGQTVVVVGGTADIAALAVHLMTNSAVTGARSTSTAGRSSSGGGGHAEPPGVSWRG